MNGGHDLGGMHGLGPIDPPDDEPIFHATWEERAFALTLAAGSRGHWNIDQSRFARESMEPGEYLRTSYYEHWLHGLEVLLENEGLIKAGEVDTRMQDSTAPEFPGFADDKVLPADKVVKTLGRGGSTRMDGVSPARFKVGDTVKTININPPTHTRLPRYARARTGVVELDHGGFQFPDVAATTGVKQCERLYTVAFSARELWGDDCEHPQDIMLLDMFDPYLIPA